MITATKLQPFFLIPNFFLTFFILFFVACNHAYIFRLFRFACVPPFPVLVFRWCAGLVSGVVLTIIHTRIHVRARGFLDSNF